MPNARRVIFSTYVVPTFSIEMEETGMTQTEFQTSPGKTLGGKGTATINATQWGDSWTSMERPEQKWEDLDSKWEDGNSLWNVNLSGEAIITTTGASHQLSSDSSDLAFLYIKNTGADNNCLVSLQGEVSAKYLITIPPGGSVHLRGDATIGDGVLDCNDVYVKSNTSTTTIEFIIAKE